MGLLTILFKKHQIPFQTLNTLSNFFSGNSLWLKSYPAPTPISMTKILHTLESEKWKCWLLSRVQLFATPWTVACQVPLSMEFSRQKYFSRGSSQPRDRTWVCCMAGRLFTIWATKEAHTPLKAHFDILSLIKSSQTLWTPTSTSVRNVSPYHTALNGLVSLCSLF